MTIQFMLFKAICQIPKSVNICHIEADFSSGEITSDGDLLVTSQMARQMRLSECLPQCFIDHQQPQRIMHQMVGMNGQRILVLAHGYEDLKYHEQLRKDQLLGAVLWADSPFVPNQRSARPAPIITP